MDLGKSSIIIMSNSLLHHEEGRQGEEHDGPTDCQCKEKEWLLGVQHCNCINGFTGLFGFASDSTMGNAYKREVSRFFYQFHALNTELVLYFWFKESAFYRIHT